MRMSIPAIAVMVKAVSTVMVVIAIVVEAWVVLSMSVDTVVEVIGFLLLSFEEVIL